MRSARARALAHLQFNLLNRNQQSANSPLIIIIEHMPGIISIQKIFFSFFFLPFLYLSIYHVCRLFH